MAAAGKTTAKAELCAICCQRIVDGKDDALFCEGSCKQWCHRYCVGVPLSHFVSLAASPSPFTCPICSQSVYEQEISLLKSSVTLLQEEVRSLKAEISSLKEGNQPSPVSIPSSAPNLEPRESVSYGGVGSGCEGGGGGGRRGVTVCGGARGRGRRGAGRVGRGGGYGGTLGRFDVGRSRESSGSSNNGGTGRGGGAGDGRRVSAGRMVRKGELAMIRLENSKKIWGTLRSTTSAAILNVFKRTTSESLANRLAVKRKYKVNVDGSVGKWWFVVRGEKSDIDALVESWDKIAMHTAWRLEDMFSFADDVADNGSLSTFIPTSAAVVSESVSNNSPRNPVSARSTDEAMTSRDLLCISPLSNVSNNDLLSSPPSQPSSNSSAHMASLAGSSSD